MRTVELIEKKRDGARLSAEEIAYLINGYTKDEIPDYQMAAFCMAIVWRGMDRRETADLTAAMVDSGTRLDLRRFGSWTSTRPAASVTRRPSWSRRSLPRAAFRWRR